MDEGDAAERLAEAARRTARLGLNSGSAGNLSLRLADGCVITPSGLAHEALVPEQLVRLDMDGHYRGSLKPSSEWR
ncbi:MAG: class II aldolase/adducin family protein, partial [Thiobacillaceae bacterium]